MITRDDEGTKRKDRAPDARAAGYLELFRQPGVLAIAAFSVLGRLPLGMEAVLLVLLLHSTTGSYAIAGAAVAINSIAFAITSPLFGRLADRGYRRTVLIVVGPLQPVAMTLLVLAVWNDAPLAVVLGCTALIGALFPPVSSITRERWTEVLPPRLHVAAFDMEALLTETLYILGPLLAAVAVLFAGPAVGLLVASGCVAIGSLLLAATPALRARPALTTIERPPRADRMLTPRVVAIVAVAFGMGMSFGQLEIAVPAFAIDAGLPAASPLLLAVWSVASVVGGLVVTRWGRRIPLETRLLLLIGINIVGFALLGLASSIWWLCGLLVLQGLFMAPAVGAEFAMAGKVAPSGRVTETFTWLTTGSYVGGAIGSAVGGLLIEAVGIPLTLSASAVFGLVAVAAAVYLRRTRAVLTP